MPRAARNWLRSPSVSARWLWDEIKFACGVKQVVEMRPGWSVICHPATYRCAYYAQLNDPDQITEFDGFIENVSQGMVFFDIGAHFGLFSLAALHYGGPEAFAIAVDPSPTASRFLTVQASLNHVAERLRVVQASVSDQGGPRKMVSVGVLASGYYVAPSSDHSERELTQTTAVTLDQLAQSCKVFPTHIKIDVEGYEAAVLKGGRQILSQSPAPIVFIELHNEMRRESGCDPADSLVLLRGYGYETFTVDGLSISDEAILENPLVRILARKT